jgi:hypothetical protein
VDWNWRRYVDSFSIRSNVDELKDLTTKYVVEETVTPVKDLGRYAAWGCLGSLFIGFGSLLVLLGTLRLLQTETTAFHGNLSWIPYFIVLVLALLEIAVVAWRVVSGPARRRLAKPESAK